MTLRPIRNRFLSGIVTMSCRLFCSALLLLACCTALSVAAEPPLRPSQQTATADVERRSDELRDVHQSLWKFAESGSRNGSRRRCSSRNSRHAGFDVKVGISGMPTAFVATYGSGKL